MLIISPRVVGPGRADEGSSGQLSPKQLWQALGQLGVLAGPQRRRVLKSGSFQGKGTGPGSSRFPRTILQRILRSR